MTSIYSTHKVHQATCDVSESTRQSAVAAAVAAGGGSAAVAAAIKTAEIAHYRRIIRVVCRKFAAFQQFHPGAYRTRNERRVK